MHHDNQAKHNQGVSMDFSSYDLTVMHQDPSQLLDMGDGVLREIAKKFGCRLRPNAKGERMPGLIKKVGPSKVLQENIAYAKDVLGPKAVDIAADWMERSGVMDAVSGSFWNPSLPLPEKISAVAWSGGVANWQLRRLHLAERLDPAKVAQVILPMGTRLMGEGEHQLVKTLTGLWDHRPTEAQFCEYYVLPALKRAEFKARILFVESGNGDEICLEFFKTFPLLLGGSIVVIGNAPNTIQAAGQLRAAALKLDNMFDHLGDQMFMLGDDFRVARKGEGPDKRQNPLSGLGQLTRSALFLERAAAS